MKLFLCCIINSFVLFVNAFVGFGLVERFERRIVAVDDYLSFMNGLFSGNLMQS